MRLNRIFILRVARHTIAICHNLCRFQHGHIDVRSVCFDPRIDKPVDIHLRGLNKRHRFQPASNTGCEFTKLDAVGDHTNGHQAGRALPVKAHPRHASWQAGADQRLPRNIHMGRPLLQCSPHDNIFDFSGGDAGAIDRMGNGMPAKCLRLRVIEGTAIGLANGGAGG